MKHKRHIKICAHVSTWISPPNVMWKEESYVVLTVHENFKTQKRIVHTHVIKVANYAWKGLKLIQILVTFGQKGGEKDWVGLEVNP